MGEKDVFTDSARTMQFLNAVYTDVAFSYRKDRWDNHGSLDPATDDAEYTYSGATQKAVILYAGTLSPVNFPFTDFWNTPYTNIRRVNLFLSKLPSTPLSAGMQSRTALEARFLRVWYYFHLVRAFGGVPLIGDKVFGINDIINIPRNSYEECVEYMVSELDNIATAIPVGYAEQDYGRATRGACLALKSRILVYAASPLFNGGAIDKAQGDLRKIVSYPAYDVARWQRAADAADAVIKSGYYSLFVDNTTEPGYGFYNVFLKRVNSEFIFARLRPANKDFENFYNPPTRGGASYHWPSHNLAEAFPMKNGKSITDPTSGYSAANPYVNRDPRFGYTITYNGALYYRASANAKQPVYTYVNAAQDGYGIRTTTGYYVAKMCDANTSAGGGANTERGWALIRYAEILLNYAEAVNETGHPELAYPKLIELRQRAGIDPGVDNSYGLAPNMTVVQMRTLLQNERRIELAFEEHRFWDMRRWKIGVAVGNGYNKCMKITSSGSTYTYEVVNSIRLHNFREEMYLFPIMQSEISKMPAMVQNPGW
ncbi:RagB/SusD family nutrient uptake outer membrane protein [Paraflavitalea speifideaquila]|uniref:RagB/SusD family nutrient uptake outer membrane protein n=1 Tax=Paraflavitalea speifideaquila TaxID=3076558 RepID=UPI0028EF81C7|nr:RagB/SusD family nutrient uptake outer membrane protein [Paraflavitalea speifideiaquila]